MSKRIRFIAETDGSGNVVWLWRVGAGDRIAKPITDPVNHVGEIATADVYGAKVDVVETWLRRNRGAGGSLPH